MNLYLQHSVVLNQDGLLMNIIVMTDYYFTAWCIGMDYILFDDIKM